MEESMPEQMEEPIQREMTEEEKEFSSKFQEYLQELDKNGNRTLRAVIKRPFPIFQATMDRFKFIKSKQPVEAQSSPGMTWEKVGAIISGVASEIGVGMADMLHNVIFLVPVAVFPKFRHPNFKLTIKSLYSPNLVRGRSGLYDLQDGELHSH
jgi:hypothetical protein